MNEYQRLRGFVLRSVAVGERDRILGLLTEHQGLISVSARGIRGSKSRHAAACQIFAFTEFELYESRGRYSLRGATLIEPYLPLQQDYERLVCASHLAEIMLDLTRDDIAQPVFYQLWAYAMEAIARRPDPLLSVRVAQLRVLAEAGLAPRLDGCGTCGRMVTELNGVFYVDACCGLVCARDRAQYAGLEQVPVDRGTMRCLEHILMAQLPRLFSFTLESEVRARIIQIADLHLTHQMEKRYQKLDLLRQSI